MQLNLVLRSRIKTVLLVIADVVARFLPVTRGLSDIANASGIYVLLHKPLGIGDVIMLSPLLNALARQFTWPVYVVTEYSPFLKFENCTWIHPEEITKQHTQSGIFVSPTLSWRHLKYMFRARLYLGYFLSNRLVSNFVRCRKTYDARNGHYFERARIIIEALGGKGDEKNIDYAALLVSNPQRPELPEEYICIAPFSNWKERQYPVRYYEEIIGDLAGSHPIVLVGGSDPQELRIAEQLGRRKGVINLVGETTLLQVAWIISRAGLFIGNDSGLAHLAFMTDTPSLYSVAYPESCAYR